MCGISAKGTPPRLHGEIQAFIKQEVIHTREHVAFNRHVTDQGYDVSLLERHIDEALALTKGRPPIASLAATMALEHFTAMLAHQLIANPRHLAGGDEQAAALWRWHAAEEIEHKGVAYDTWLHATRDWPRRRRWMVKALVMIGTTKKFFAGRYKGMLELLRQDGITGWRAHRGILWYALGRPGMARKILGAWVAFFLPGFHPWNHERPQTDRAGRERLCGGSAAARSARGLENRFLARFFGHMDAALDLFPPAPASGTGVFARQHFGCAGRAADRGIAFGFERMTRQFMVSEIRVEPRLVPIRQWVELQPTLVFLEARHRLTRPAWKPLRPDSQASNGANARRSGSTLRKSQQPSGS